MLILCYHNTHVRHESIVCHHNVAATITTIQTLVELVLDLPIAWVSAVLEPAILAATENVLFIIEQQDHITASIQALMVMFNNSLVLKEL